MNLSSCRITQCLSKVISRNIVEFPLHSQIAQSMYKHLQSWCFCATLNMTFILTKNKSVCVGNSLFFVLSEVFRNQQFHHPNIRQRDSGRQLRVEKTGIQVKVHLLHVTNTRGKRASGKNAFYTFPLLTSFLHLTHG